MTEVDVGRVTTYLKTTQVQTYLLTDKLDI